VIQSAKLLDRRRNSLVSSAQLAQVYNMIALTVNHFGVLVLSTSSLLFNASLTLSQAVSEQFIGAAAFESLRQGSAMFSSYSDNIQFNKSLLV
jgi:hypothetical protein